MFEMKRKRKENSFCPIQNIMLKSWPLTGDIENNCGKIAQIKLKIEHVISMF